jgi:hypothetical protein
VTSYEDLPADLFGEPEAAPDDASSRGAPATDADAARPAAPAPSEATDDAPPTDGPAPDARPAPAPGRAAGDEAVDAEDRSPIAMVQSLFPGRIVALEPLATDEDEAGDDDAPPAAMDGPDGGPGDGPSRASG